MTFDEHSGNFECRARASRGRSQTCMLILSVLMKSSFVPPPQINQTVNDGDWRGNVRRRGRRVSVSVGDNFDLSCSVTVDFGVRVELSWTTPLPLGTPRLKVGAQTARNMSMGATHLMMVQRVSAYTHVRSSTRHLTSSVCMF